jgi:hypothetical protein
MFIPNSPKKGIYQVGIENDPPPEPWDLANVVNYPPVKGNQTMLGLVVIAVLYVMCMFL